MELEVKKKVYLILIPWIFDAIIHSIICMLIKECCKQQPSYLASLDSYSSMLANKLKAATGVHGEAVREDIWRL